MVWWWSGVGREGRSGRRAQLERQRSSVEDPSESVPCGVSCEVGDGKGKGGGGGEPMMEVGGVQLAPGGVVREWGEGAL
eukprot:3315723-Rhodomonas_salina.1